jgi:hypothetical protein
MYPEYSVPSLFYHRACCYQYLLKPTHAQLKTHVKTHCFNTLKCPSPYRPTCFGRDTDHPQGLSVPRTATCSHTY